MRRVAPLVLVLWLLSVLGAALQPCIAAIAVQSGMAHANQQPQLSNGHLSAKGQSLKHGHLHAALEIVSGHDSHPVGNPHCADYLDIPIVVAEAKQAPARGHVSDVALHVQCDGNRLQGQPPRHPHAIKHHRANVHPPDILRRTSRLLI